MKSFSIKNKLNMSFLGKSDKPQSLDAKTEKTPIPNASEAAAASAGADTLESATSTRAQMAPTHPSVAPGKPKPFLGLMGLEQAIRNDVDRELKAPARRFSMKRDAAGCIVRMPDGNVCVAEPRNHFGGWHTFPKGGVDPGESLAEAARREVHEETGLNVKLTRYVMDQNRSTSMTRYFIADAVSGSARDFRPDETQATLQVPLRSLPFYLSNPKDHEVLWHILRSSELSGMLMPDAHQADAQKMTGRDKLYRALLRAPGFWSPSPTHRSGATYEDLLPTAPALKPVAEHEVLAPGAPRAAVVSKGTGAVACMETRRLVDILPKFTAESVAVFDVDLTLTAAYADPKHPWRYQTATVEPYTATLVKALQDCGVPVLGLTARAPHEMASVSRSLTNLGIDLSRTSPLPQNFQLASPHPSQHTAGLICTSDYNTKGEMLSLVHQKAPFKHAVMVDDNVNNFFSLIQAARKSAFDLTCVSYQAAIPPGSYASQWDLVTRLAADKSSFRILNLQAKRHRADMVARREARLQAALTTPSSLKEAGKAQEPELPEATKTSQLATDRVRKSLGVGKTFFNTLKSHF